MQRKRQGICIMNTIICSRVNGNLKRLALECLDFNVPTNESEKWVVVGTSHTTKANVGTQLHQNTMNIDLYSIEKNCSIMRDFK